MLPLSIYLSDEYSVLDLRTLYRAIEHYLYMPDLELEEALEAFLIHPPESQSCELPPLAELEMYEPIDHAEANSNFNRDLTEPSDTSPLFIYPQHLHPRFNALIYPRIEKDLLKRLMPLIPDENDAPVYLAPINEERLTVELQLLVKLIQSGACKDRIGICISCASKRAIPTLGWLQKLAQNEGIQIPVCLLRGDNLEEQSRNAIIEALPDYPILRSRALINAQYRFVFELFDSESGSQLKPILIDPPADLLERAQANQWPCFGAPHWSSINPQLDNLPTPLDLFADERQRAEGFMLGQPGLADAIATQVETLRTEDRPVQPVINGTLRKSSEIVDICATQDVNQIIGQRMIPNEAQVREALAVVEEAQPAWDLQSVQERSRRLMEFAR